MGAPALGSNRSTHDESTEPAAIAINATTAVTILSANSSRLYVYFYSNKDVWIRRRTAASNNTKTGLFLPKNTPYEFYGESTYIGEYSAISNVGSGNLYVVEY